MHKKGTEIGVGQASIIYYRYMNVDYLPSMFLNAFLVMSKRPRAIGKIDTLIYPLDKSCWYLMVSSIFAIFIALILIQKSWIIASGERPTNTWIFQGTVLYMDKVKDNWQRWYFWEMLSYRLRPSSNSSS